MNFFFSLSLIFLIFLLLCGFGLLYKQEHQIHWKFENFSLFTVHQPVPVPEHDTDTFD